MSDLSTKRCSPCTGDTPRTPADQVEKYLRDLAGWSTEADGGSIARTFEFKNFYESMAFANAVAFIAHRENHHPDLEIGYKRCRVRYVTHAIGGLSENDFICAAKVNALLTG